MLKPGLLSKVSKRRFTIANENHSYKIFLDSAVCIIKVRNLRRRQYICQFFEVDHHGLKIKSRSFYVNVDVF